MTNIDTAHASKPASLHGKRDSNEIIRQLEQFPVEALEAALYILQSQKPNQTR